MIVKKIFLLFFMLIFISFLYISFAYVFNINKMFLPDFWLLIVIFIGFYIDGSIRLLLAFFIGILKDVFEIGVFGSNVFLFLVIIFFLKDISNNIYKEKFINVFIMMFFVSFLYYFLKYFLCVLFGYEVVFSYEYILKSIINSLIAPYVFYFIIKINEWFDYVAK